MPSLGDPNIFTISGLEAVRGRSRYVQSTFDLKQLEQGSPRLHFSLRCLQRSHDLYGQSMSGYDAHIKLTQLHLFLHALQYSAERLRSQHLRYHLPIAK